MIDTLTSHYELLATLRTLPSPGSDLRHYDQEVKVGNYKTLAGLEKAIVHLTKPGRTVPVVSYVVYEVTEKVIRQQTLIPVEVR